MKKDSVYKSLQVTVSDLNKLNKWSHSFQQFMLLICLKNDLNIFTN